MICQGHKFFRVHGHCPRPTLEAALQINQLGKSWFLFGSLNFECRAVQNPLDAAELVRRIAVFSRGQSPASIAARSTAEWQGLEPRSVKGQTEKSGCSTGRSALPSITDIVNQACQVRQNRTRAAQQIVTHGPKAKLCMIPATG